MSHQLSTHALESSPITPLTMPSTSTILYQGGIAAAIIIATSVLIGVLLGKIIGLIEAVKK